MGGLNFLGLNIEGPGIYFGGQTVNGQVIVDASEEQTNIKSVEVKLKGKGEVHFTETVRCDIIYFDSINRVVVTKLLLTIAHINFHRLRNIEQMMKVNEKATQIPIIFEIRRHM